MRKDLKTDLEMIIELIEMYRLDTLQKNLIKILTMEKEWFKFQEVIKEHFVSLGCVAKTNVTIKGVRTNHDIDVLVESKFLGQDLKWIIEAKKWKSKVSKLHVIALSKIVEETGADKGFIISENGFQKGAIEASENSNITLLTYSELVTSTNEIIQKTILKKYLDRLNLIFNKYYSHSKVIRIKYNLRQGLFDYGYSAYSMLFTIADVLGEGFKNEYPIENNIYLITLFKDVKIENFNQLINWLNRELLNIEEKILIAEIEMQKNNDYEPNLRFIKTKDNIIMIPFKRFLNK